MKESLRTIDDLYSIFDFEEIGICVSTPEKKVVFQNDRCKLICGNQALQSCELCKNICCQETQMNVFPFHSKIKVLFGTKQSIGKHLCDIYKYVEKEKKELTVLYPIKEKISKHSNFFREKNFTPRELEIAFLIMENNSNSAMQEKLYISKATLKTHLNHIYQKYPAFKSMRSKNKSTF